LGLGKLPKADRAGDLFPKFVRSCVRARLKSRGYTHAGRTFRKTHESTTAHLIFMRYTGAHAGHFDVRMTLTLDPWASDLGAVIVEDLSRRVYGSVAATGWRWPCEESAWPALAGNLLPDVEAGADWMESLFQLPALAAYLEQQRRFTPDADLERDRIAQAMEAAGVAALYVSPG
jgi:hypothetical protein